MKVNNKSIRKYVKNNIARYSYEDLTIYLKIIEPIKSKYIIWYQSLRCVLQIKFNTINLREESKHSVTTLQVPSLLLKHIGLLQNITLIDDNNRQLKKNIFRAYDIKKALTAPSIDSLNTIFDNSFTTLFAEAEGWKSKEIAPYLKELYKIIYKNTLKVPILNKKIANLLSVIKAVNHQREKHYKINLRKANDTKRAERQKLKGMLGEISPLMDAITTPQNNFESNDTISIIGSIISILILLKRFQLQYIELKHQKSPKYTDLELCKYDKNKARSCKISLNKLLNAYMSKSIHHVNLGQQFRAILLFNASITKEQEMQIILWLARMETAFTTPLDIVKGFLFHCHNAWIPLPTPNSTTNLGALMTLDLKLAEKALPEDWGWHKFHCWPDTNYANQLKKDGDAAYTSGCWASILMEEYYERSLQSLIEPVPAINIEDISDSFYIMSDYITLLSIQPNSNLEVMPDLTKVFEKDNSNNILWMPINRFPAAIAKLEMTRIHQQEINYINTVKQLQNLIDNSFLFFTKIYHEIKQSDVIHTLNINTKHYELNNNANLARYITNSKKQKTIKDFNNWINPHQQHIKYYIASIIDRLLPFVPNDENKELHLKQAYLIALKLLYKIYQKSKRATKSSYISKKKLFPAKNSNSASNTQTETLKHFLIEPIITCILFNLDPQKYLYLPLKVRLKQYRDFVDFLYKSETLSLENNLIRK